jgi:Zn-dependent protease with chaperone function
MKIYLKNDSEASGPFSSDELQDRIYSGDLSRMASARTEDTENWVPLESLLNGKSIVPAEVAAPQIAVPLERLRDRKEKTALVWLYIASAPIWILLILWTVASMGIPLIFVGLFWMFHAIGELWFSAYLKTNAVRVSEKQLPDLNSVVDTCCQNLALERPDVYVMQQNVWNAFATKIFKRRVVVLYSGAVDSILLKGDMRQLTWLVGHELGHHWAGHLDAGQKIAKLGGWLIWVNLWHSRRAELTCDRVGLYCAGSVVPSQLALMNATVGAQLAGKVNVAAAAEQWQQHRDEFFVKYRTLYSTHPHLLARLDHLNSSAQEFGMSR